MGGPSQQEGRESSPATGFAEAVRELAKLTTNASRDASIKELLAELEIEYVGEVQDGKPLIERYDELQRSIGCGTPSDVFRAAGTAPIREHIHQEHAPRPSSSFNNHSDQGIYPSSERSLEGSFDSPFVERETRQQPGSHYENNGRAQGYADRAETMEQIQELTEKFDKLSGFVIRVLEERTGPGEQGIPSGGDYRGQNSPGQLRDDRGSSRRDSGTRLIEDDKLKALLLDVKELRTRNSELVKMIRDYREREKHYQNEIKELKSSLHQERKEHAELQRSHEKLLASAKKIHEYYMTLSRDFNTLDNRFKTVVDENQELAQQKAKLLKIAARAARTEQVAPHAAQGPHGAVRAQAAAAGVFGAINLEEAKESVATIGAVYVGNELTKQILPDSAPSWGPLGGGIALAALVLMVFHRGKQKRAH